jgi:hypothetical protein
MTSPHRLTVTPVDAPLVCAGEPNAYPLNTTAVPDTATYGVSSVLWDNLWVRDARSLFCCS